MFATLCFISTATCGSGYLSQLEPQRKRGVLRSQVPLPKPPMQGMSRFTRVDARNRDLEPLVILSSGGVITVDKHESGTRADDVLH